MMVVEPVCQALIEYWYSIRGSDTVPSRSDVRPADIRQLLPNVMMLEYRPGGELIFRLVGSAIVDKLGKNFTGMNQLDLFPKAQRAFARQRYVNLLEQPCGLHVHRDMRSRFGAEFVADVVYLPLRDRSGLVSQLIAVAAVAGGGVCERHESASLTPREAFEYLDLGSGVPGRVPQQAVSG